MEEVAKIFAIFIPIIAVVGGITLAIVRVFTQARLEELARRERIAAIERGVDPEKLATFVASGKDAHGLLIGSLIVLAVGLGLSITFYFVEPHENHWVMGILPVLVGLALLASSMVVWPRGK
jgi:hypothetical protein